jgi:biotin synthase
MHFRRQRAAFEAGNPMSNPPGTAAVRTDWTLDEVRALFALPFPELLFRAQTIHRQHFPAGDVQVSQLLSIKTGGCPEDCGYCPQSVHFQTGVEGEALLPLPVVLDAARRARASGATRFCMGAAYRNPKPSQLARISDMVREVKALGLETCATLGMLTAEQAETLRDAGLDYYNHNLDTSAEHYGKVISTRTYQDRLDTLANVRAAGLKVCAGGIIGLGETIGDRAALLHTLATLPSHPESVPINQLVAVEGTPLADSEPVDPIDFVRVIAVARILMPATRVRLSAGRTDMSDELQALCFLAGANSIFYGERLLTTPNPAADHDLALLRRLGMGVEPGPALA